MPDPTYIQGQAAAVTVRSVSVTFPGGVQTGDVVYFYCSTSTTPQPITTPTGWVNVLGGNTTVDSDVSMCCGVYHIVTSGENGSTTFTATNLFNTTPTGNVLAAVIRGVDTATPVDNAGSTFNVNAVTPFVLAAITGTGSALSSNSLVVSGVAKDGPGTYTTPGTHTQRQTINTNGGSWLGTHNTYTTANTDVAAVNITPSAADEYVSISVAFTVASAATATPAVIARAVTIPAATAFTPATVTQEGFRWRNDDGTETTATWKAAQDTNASLDVGQKARLRVVLDATFDPSPAAYTLYYKKTTDGTWLPVPVGTGGGSPVYVAPSTNITASGEATTALLTPPAGKTTADFSVGRMWDDENGTDLVDIGAASFLPTDLTNCVLWLDADDATSFTYSSGVEVSQWNDKSGGSRHVSQATVGKQPSRTGTLNGRSIVTFTRANVDCLRRTGSAVLSGTAATLFIVAYLDGAPSGSDDRVFSVSSTPNEDYQAGGAVFIYGTASYYPDSYRDGAGSTSHASTQMHTQWLKITSLFDGTNHTMYTGSTAYTPVASTATFAATETNLGCVKGGTQTANMRVAELILYSDAKGSTDRTTVWGYLTTKWGI